MTSRIDPHPAFTFSKTDVPAVLLSLPVRDGRYDNVAAGGAFSNPPNATDQMQAVIERNRIQVNDVAGITAFRDPLDLRRAVRPAVHSAKLIAKPVPIGSVPFGLFSRRLSVFLVQLNHGNTACFGMPWENNSMNSIG